MLSLTYCNLVYCFSNNVFNSQKRFFLLSTQFNTVTVFDHQERKYSESITLVCQRQGWCIVGDMVFCYNLFTT